MHRSHRPRPFGPWAAVVALLSLALLAGCATTSPTAAPSSATAPTVLPEGAGPDTSPPKEPDPRDCTKSLEPPWNGVPSAQVARGAVAKIKANNQLVVGVDQTTRNWGEFDAGTGKFQGFDIDTLVEVARAIFGGDPVADGTIQFRVVANADRQNAVSEHRVDLLAETMTVTCDRQNLPVPGNDKPPVAFSSVYFLAGQGVLVPKDSPIDSKQLLDGKRVCATKGSTSLNRMKDLSSQDIHVIPWEAATQTDCLVLLQQGQVDAISTDDTILAGLQEQDPSLVVLKGDDGLPLRLQEEPYGIAVAQDRPELVEFVNAVLARDRNDPSSHGWQARYTHWVCPPGSTACPGSPLPAIGYSTSPANP